MYHRNLRIAVARCYSLLRSIRYCKLEVCICIICSLVGDGSSLGGDGSALVGGGSTLVGDGSTLVGDGSALVGDGSTLVGDITRITKT